MTRQAKYFRYLFLTIFILGLFLEKTGLAGPPFFSDDPVPVEYKHTEIYFASTYIRDKGGTSGSLPMLDMNYGILPELHAHVTTPFNFSQEKIGQEDEAGELHRARTQYGYGDTELGFKWRLIQERKFVPQLAVYPLLELPTGNSKKELGAGEPQLFLPVWIQKSWGKWTSYGGCGYWFNPENENWTYLGGVLQREFSEWLTLGGEILYRTADKVDERNGLGVNFGGQINVTKNHHILGSAGTDVQGPKRATVYAAYQLTF